jgi:SAM-dependent methyltransferase
MNLLNIVRRTPVPPPWSEGDNIPWHDAEFSARMLAEHLSQEHDLASRRLPTIDAHVTWIHDALLGGQTARLLDLGCGPGLYANRLAQLGHTCTGIDYSPASIDYARATAAAAGLACTYHLADLRAADYGQGYDLAMLLYGELNVFSPTHIAKILDKTHAALRPGGRLLLEPHTFAALALTAASETGWFSSPGGLFSPAPHLCLTENHWDPAGETQTRRYYVIDAATAALTFYAQSLQAYHEAGYCSLLARRGFVDVRVLPGLAPDRLPPADGFCAIVATRP